jgi:broad specificity phosphatase PhoE
MATLWFARHGQSTWNAEGRWQGQADPPLSELGRAQAEALAEALSGAGIALLVSSDLERARETARIVGARLGLDPVLEPALREHDVGAWSGLTHAEIEARWPEELARFRAGDLALAPGGGESRLALRTRVRAALARLEARAGGPLALVSHLGVLRALAPGVHVAPGGLLRLDADSPAQLAERGDPARTSKQPGPIQGS